MSVCRMFLAVAVAVVCSSLQAQELPSTIAGPNQGYAGQVGSVPSQGYGPAAPADMTLRPQISSGPLRYGSGDAVVVAPPQPERTIESSWYTRVDYFHWNERLDGMDFVNEDGPLITLGYVRRVGPERFRLEVFGGTMHYKGYGQFPDGSLDPLSSDTDYLGMRGEYDLLIEPDMTPQISYFIGVGTRFWVRDIKDGVSQGGYYIGGYEELWWGLYPYLGFEKRRIPSSDMEFYWSGRIGCTPLNFERVGYFDVTLHPRTGVTGQLEAGLRNRHFTLSAFFEGTTWGQSPEVDGVLQPKSQMTTVGMRSGFCF